ncbi:uncharacterized protein MONBRDRAFT_32187 [Monosiga brevicollis MX1]|uniref:Uncharacterized protein n=1 Tax=Monosiga brevicollis TaxID=81824 RepID=A9UY76_MONBE|nr:uncharacterized protein MONBRDRAFT_32187 [Monosiga brevicollis MX1]EDQ89975.1 predicted protein [Monosiga brevicollis MX1]|eukprot:XP_001745397.1 hypothetical protein [Monosiga brevicollis MX1]
MVSLHSLSEQERTDLLTLGLYSIAYNPGTAAPRSLKLRPNAPRDFRSEVNEVSYSIHPEHHEYQAPEESSIELLQNETDGRVRTHKDLRLGWKNFLLYLGRLASGAQPCPCQASKPKAPCGCGTVQLSQELRTTFLCLPEWKIIREFSNAKDIKLHLRGVLDISDRFTADKDKIGIFNDTIKFINALWEQLGLRLVPNGLQFSLERTGSSGLWTKVPNPPRNTSTKAKSKATKRNAKAMTSNAQTNKSTTASRRKRIQALQQQAQEALSEYAKSATAVAQSPDSSHLSLSSLPLSPLSTSSLLTPAAMNSEPDNEYWRCFLDGGPQDEMGLQTHVTSESEPGQPPAHLFLSMGMDTASDQTSTSLQAPFVWQSSDDFGGITDDLLNEAFRIQDELPLDSFFTSA